MEATLRYVAPCQFGLEGILAATERRLLEYIREERVLRQRLEEREAKT